MDAVDIFDTYAIEQIFDDTCRIMELWLDSGHWADFQTDLYADLYSE